MNELERAVCAGVDRREPEFRGFLKELVALESHSPDKPGVDRAGRLCVLFAEKLGFTAKVTVFQRAGDAVLLRVPGADGRRPVAFLAHLDTVHETGSFPRMLEERDGFLYGPGAVDCKGGVAAALLAMEALREAGCKRELRLLLTPDEELSSALSGPASVEWIEENTRGCAAAISCECAAENEAVVERKGVWKVTVAVRGRAAHAGMHYAQGISAVREAAHKIIRLEERSDPERITYNCGRITGGEADNVVPALCEFHVDVRYRSQREWAEAEAWLREVVETPALAGTAAEYQEIGNRIPMERTEAGMALFRLLQQVGEELGTERLVPLLNGGGSDAAFTAAAGIPSICGMGMTGFDWHTKEERVWLASLARRAKLLAVAAARIEA